MMICNEISHVPHIETGENKSVSKIDLNLKSSTPIGQWIKSCEQKIVRWMFLRKMSNC